MIFKAIEPSEWESAKGCSRRKDRQRLVYLGLSTDIFGAVASYPVNRLMIMRQANASGKYARQICQANRAKSLSLVVSDHVKASKGAITVKGNGMVPARATGEERKSLITLMTDDRISMTAKGRGHENECSRPDSSSRNGGLIIRVRVILIN
jgi:hypothetical protein